MKKIITHINPDIDAVAGVWLIKRFLPDWQKAEIDFCPAQSTIDGQPVDANPDILHVDVSLGKLDHHQTGEYLSAAKLCWKYIQAQRKQPLSPLDVQALDKIVEVVTTIDNARDLNWPEAKDDRFDFYFHSILSGDRGMAKSDREVVEFGMVGMDAIFHKFKARLRAQEELKNGTEFVTPWGKAIALETGNEAILWEGEKRGYCLVARKDPQNGGVRIYARYDTKVNLKKAYEKFKKMDPDSDWFLHASGKLLLNESRIRKMKPTKLGLKEIMEVLSE